MKKVIVGIFAHPDDEAMGPGGTLALLSQTHDVYIICVTNGDATIGDCLIKNGNLGQIRQKELEKSAKILGIKKVFFLDFKDGELNNNLYHEIAAKIENVLKKLKAEIIITFEMHGLSGHLDHIAVSMITTYIVESKKLASEIWYFCHSEIFNNTLKDELKDYFIYFPNGYKKSEIDNIIDIKDVWDKKIKAINCHKSQLIDVEKNLRWLNKLPKEEYFLIRKTPPAENTS